MCNNLFIVLTLQSPESCPHSFVMKTEISAFKQAWASLIRKRIHKNFVFVKLFDIQSKRKLLSVLFQSLVFVSWLIHFDELFVSVNYLFQLCIKTNWTINFLTILFQFLETQKSYLFWCNTNPNSPKFALKKLFPPFYGERSFVYRSILSSKPSSFFLNKNLNFFYNYWTVLPSYSKMWCNTVGIWIKNIGIMEHFTCLLFRCSVIVVFIQAMS